MLTAQTITTYEHQLVRNYTSYQTHNLHTALAPIQGLNVASPITPFTSETWNTPL